MVVPQPSLYIIVCSAIVVHQSGISFGKPVFSLSIVASLVKKSPTDRLLCLFLAFSLSFFLSFSFFFSFLLFLFSFSFFFLLFFGFFFPFSSSCSISILLLFSPFLTTPYFRHVYLQVYKNAPCKSPLSREMFTAHFMTKFPQIPPFLSFQCSTLFSARSGKINLCCMPYLPFFSNEVHIVNVKPEDSGLSEENRDGGLDTWMKASGSKKPPMCVRSVGFPTTNVIELIYYLPKGLTSLLSCYK